MAGVQAERDVFGVRGVEDPRDLIGGLDVRVTVRVQDHRQAVVLLHHFAQPVGVVDVEVPRIGRQNAVIGELPSLVVAVEGRQVDDILGTERGVRLTNGAECLLGIGPSLLFVQDAPACAGHDTHATLVDPALQLLGILREIAVWAGLEHLKAGLGHLAHRDVGIDLFWIIGEPDAPLVRAHANGELGVARVLSVDGLVFVVERHRCLLQSLRAVCLPRPRVPQWLARLDVLGVCLLSAFERRRAGDDHVPPTRVGRVRAHQVGFDVDHRGPV